MTEQPTYEQLLEEIKDLKKSVELYSALLDNSPDMLYRTDLQGRVTYVSSSVYKLSGYTVEEALGLNMAKDGYYYPEDREAFLKKLQEKGQVNNYEAKMKRKDGSMYWVSTNAHFIKDKEGNLIGVEGISRDIGELKMAEEALRKSEERFRSAFHTSPDSITISRANDGLIIDINEGFTKIMGYTREDAVGKGSMDLNIWKDPADRKRLIDDLSKNGFVENMEAEFVSKDDKIKIGLMSARLLKIDEEDCILLITRDITEHKRMELQLHQANKLQALGTLAGGIAHNFNNLLMGIQGHASLIKTDYGPEYNLLDRVQGIEQCVQSATHLTKQLLGLARDGKYEIKAIDINELLINSANMFGRTHREIQILTNLHHEQIIIKADRNQIEQVLLNLFVNSAQAMPSGGKLILGTSIVVMNEAQCQSQQIDPGPYCIMSIADTGHGMEEEICQRVFDPFFTTKETDLGTGLGLSSAYGIVKNHGGTMDVHSEINRGATFNIYLPLSSEKVTKDVAQKEEIIRGSEKILLVDDEEVVLEVAKAMLEKLGYNVIVSMNGEEAIKEVEKHAEAIDLVVLDLIMPGLDGGKTFDHIRELQPNMPVILSSGYSLSEQAADIMNRGCNGFIQKPFNLYKLSQKVRQILDEGKE